MTNKFMTIQTMKILQRGTKGMGTLTSDLIYIERGHYPIIDNPIAYDSLTHIRTNEYVVDEGNKVVDRVYTLTAKTLDEVKNIKLSELDKDVKLNKRPIVDVPLEDTSTIQIFGSKEDQSDIGDRYDLMKEDSIPNLYLKDASGSMQYLGHLDVKRCHKAITIHRNTLIEYQWAKEVEINNCVTVQEVEAVTWTI